jgi:N-acetylmuramoyl-L-alanine amidase
MRKYFYFLFALCTLSCSYKGTNRTYIKQAKVYSKIIKNPPAPITEDSLPLAPLWVGTTNFDMRKPNFVIIHHTAQNSCDETLRTFTMPRTKVSAHYVICREGTVHHMLNDYLRAWQAGISRWGNVNDVNSVSIGIELDNNGFEPFSDAQINSLLHLLNYLKKKYSIPAVNFIGHADVAPTRKDDPNYRFPWKRLADNGFGLWYGDTTNVEVPDAFNNLQALRIIGYDVRDSVAAFQSFKRHFEGVDSKEKTLNDADRKILYKLSGKYL